MTTASLRRPIYGPRGRKTTFARRSLLREVSVDAEVGSYESLRAGDIRFPYHRTGMGGLPIILLHGWPPTSHVWRRVAPLLSSECDIVTPDLSGFGYTSKPDAGFDKKTIARRLRDFVRHSACRASLWRITIWVGTWPMPPRHNGQKRSAT